MFRTKMDKPWTELKIRVCGELSSWYYLVPVLTVGISVWPKQLKKTQTIWGFFEQKYIDDLGFFWVFFKKPEFLGVLLVFFQVFFGFFLGFFLDFFWFFL